MVTETSAEVTMLVLSEAVLLPLLGSLVVLLTVAVFVCVPGVADAATVYFTVMVTSLPPAAIVPSAQLKFPPAPGVHVPCEVVIEPPTWVKPAGQVSLTLTACASEGPPLCTVIV